MKYRFDGYNWLVRLEKGEKLVESLLEIARTENIKGAWLSGLGAAQSAELGFYDLESQEYRFQTVNKLMEITSLQGNVAWLDGEPVLHIHGTFSDDKLQAFGGHVKELVVGGTCEVLLHRWYGEQLERQTDPATGLNLLNL